MTTSKKQVFNRDSSIEEITDNYKDFMLTKDLHWHEKLDIYQHVLDRDIKTDYKPYKFEMPKYEGKISKLEIPYCDEYDSKGDIKSKIEGMKSD